MKIDYEKIQKSLDEYGQHILECIKRRYGKSLTDGQLQTVDRLLHDRFIVVEEPSKEDIEFFSRQAGIEDPSAYSVDYVPSAHGGRTKNDNKIHIYPYAKSFSDCKNDDEIIDSCIESIVVHEIFHYFIRPNLSNESETLKDEFGHFITEGLVQYYTEEFEREHNLGKPKSNYGKNVRFAKKLISSFPVDLTQAQIDNVIFTHNQDELLSIARDGEALYTEYMKDIELHESITGLLNDMCSELGRDKNDESRRGIIRHYQKMDDHDKLFEELYSNIEILFSNSVDLKEAYISRLRNIRDTFENIERKRFDDKTKDTLENEERRIGK